MCSTCNKSINGRKKGGRKQNRNMKKRKYSRVRGLNQKDLGNVAVQAGVGAAGAVALRMILGKVLPAEYQQYTNYALFGAGVLAAGMSKNPMMINAGMGAAVVGGTGVVQDLVDGQEAGGGAISLLPPGKNYNPQVYPKVNGVPQPL